MDEEQATTAALAKGGSASSQPAVYGLFPDELRADFERLELRAYRAKQVWRWLYVDLAGDWQAMTNLPADLRGRLAEIYCLSPATVRGVAGDPAGTRKLLLELPDGELIEEVLIPAPDRRTVCVSSQVGCKFKCAFCASGQSGFQRSLETAEMVAQVVLAAREYKDRPTNVVFMGIGEPFDNYDNVLKAARIINDAGGLNIGARRITISTSGVIPGIQRLASEGIQLELSVSLHAPDDKLRSALMPINRKYPLADLLAACTDYAQRTNRIVTFEYTLIKGVNDSREQAEALVRTLRPVACRVNLIPLSTVEEYVGEASPSERVSMFLDVLSRARINTTVRASKGSDVRGACGQLRSQTMRQPEVGDPQSGDHGADVA